MSSTISFNGLDRFFTQHGDEVGQLVGRTLSARRPLRSRTVVDFEERFADAIGRPGARAVSVRSGTDALHFALRGLGVGAGDEVIVTSYSFVASASAVRLCGARPVFVDIDPMTGMTDLDDVRRSLGPKTRAIVGVQLYGHLLSFDELEALAAEAGVLLVEDSAQAFGSRRGGRRAGSLGTASTFSFDPTKALGGLETGGIVVTSNPELVEAVLALRHHGWNRHAKTFERLGYNSQLSTANAAMLLWRLDREAERREQRQELARRLERRLSGLPSVSLTPYADDEDWNAYRFALRLACPSADRVRDHLLEHLSEHGIEAKVHYRYVLPDLGATGDDTTRSVPRARERSLSTLSLPLHPELTFDDIDRVADRVSDFVARRV